MYRIISAGGEPLRDPAHFDKLAVDEFGVVCWPNGADLAPDAIDDDLVKGSTPS